MITHYREAAGLHTAEPAASIISLHTRGQLSSYAHQDMLDKYYDHTGYISQQSQQ